MDWFPIFDVYLWGILGAGVGGAWLASARRRGVAVAALALVAAYGGLRAVTHDVAVGRAIEIQARAGIPVPDRPPGFFSYLNAGRRSALPAALSAGSSPFAWRLITRAPSGFEVRDVNLLAGGPAGAPPVRLRFPDSHSPLIARAALAPTARVFLDFSRFTSVEVRRHRNGDATVHWYDMRFGRPAVGTDERTYTSPFGAWVRLASDGRMLGYGLGPG